MALIKTLHFCCVLGAYISRLLAGIDFFSICFLYIFAAFLLHVLRLFASIHVLHSNKIDALFDRAVKRRGKRSDMILTIS